MSRKPADPQQQLPQPADSVVQSLLAETRSLKVALARARIELEEAKGATGGPDPRVAELQAELLRIRTQLDDARAEVNLLRTERDELRDGVERALAQIEEAPD
jgi:chromosome segregation ATPase